MKNRLLMLGLSFIVACTSVETADQEGGNNNTISPTAGSTAGATAGATAGQYVAGMIVQATSSGLQITAPLNQQVFTTTDITITGVHPTENTVIINGESVEVINGSFSKTLSYMAEGPQTVTVADRTTQSMVSFFIDLNDPILDIEAPFYGTFVEYPNQVLVKGFATDSGSGIQSVYVNGTAASIEANGAFYANVTPPIGLNKILVEVTDRAARKVSNTRAVLAGEFRDWSGGLKDAITLKVNAPSFDVVERALITQVENGLVDQLIAQAQGQSDFQIRAIRFQSIGVDFIPSYGYIDLKIQINQLAVDVATTQPVVGEVTGTVHANPAILTAKVYLSASPSGNLDVMVQDLNLDLQQFEVELDSTILDVVVSLFESYIPQYVDSALRDIVQQYLVDELIQPELLNPTFNFLKYQTQLHIRLTEVDIIPERLLAKADIKLDEISVYHENPGYLYVGNMDTPMLVNEMVNVALPGNFFHFLFGHLWKGGLLDIDLDQILTDPPAPLMAGALNGFANGHLAEYMALTDYVKVSLRPMLPPTARFSPNEPSFLFIDGFDLFLDLKLPDGRAFATFAIDVMGKIRPSIVNGEFHLDLGLETTVRFIEAPIFEVKGQQLVNLLQPLLNTLPELAGSNALDNAFDLTQLELFGIKLKNAVVNSSPLPNPFFYLGVSLEAP